MALENKAVKDKGNVGNKKTIDIDEQWEKRLTYYETTGKIINSIDNFYVILKNHRAFKDKIQKNLLSQGIEILKNNKLCPLQTVDSDKIQQFIEREYGIHNDKKFMSALRVVAEEKAYHPIKNYLESLTWDGVKRLDTAFTDYLGASNTPYNSMCLRLILSGAIERVYNPGAKFDYMLILKGGQGVGKSTFFRLLCGNNEWYQDDFDNVKDSFDKTNGRWFCEVSELAAFKKAETERLKGFITITQETHRIPYEPLSKVYPRQFVLFGTTNEEVFLSDITGNRRFPVVTVAKSLKTSIATKSLFHSNTKYEMEQILAEAFYNWKNGNKILEIPKEFQADFEENQRDSQEDDYMVGIIQDYLENKEFCSPIDIWCEAFGHKKSDRFPPAESKRIATIIRQMGNWRLYSGNNTHRKRIIVKVGYGNYQETHNYGSQIAYEKFTPYEEIKKEQEEKEQKVKDKVNKNINKIMGTEGQDYFMEIGDNYDKKKET